MKKDWQTNSEYLSTLNAEDSKIFSTSEFGSLTVYIDQNNDVWFIAKEVAEKLGYKNTWDAVLKHVAEEDRTPRVLRGEGVNGQYTRELTTINESGLYSLILSSKLESAKKFKRWVTSEILPSIRKHGAFLTDDKIEEVLSDPDTIIRLATDLKNERQKRIAAEKEVESKQRYIDYTKDDVELSKHYLNQDECITLAQFCHRVSRFGYEIGLKRLYKMLRDMKWVCSTSCEPTQYACRQGWLIGQINIIQNREVYQSLLTRKGVQKLLVIIHQEDNNHESDLFT